MAAFRVAKQTFNKKQPPQKNPPGFSCTCRCPQIPSHRARRTTWAPEKNDWNLYVLSAVTSRYVQRMLNLRYIGSCLNTGSQWIVKVNKASCIKMERLFTHCYRVLATPNVYIHTCTHQMLGNTNHLWKMMFLHEFPFKNFKLHSFRGPSSSLFKLQGFKYFKKHPPGWTHSPNLREKGILLVRFGKDIPWKSKSTIEIIGFSPKTIFFVGNLNHPKLGTMFF